MELLSLPGITLERLSAIWPELKAIPSDVAELLEIDAHYAGYLERQDQDIAAFRQDESLVIPAGFDYAAIGGLSTECRLKLTAVRPWTLGQASRIDGVTPAALTLILAAIRHAAHPARYAISG